MIELIRARGLHFDAAKDAFEAYYFAAYHAYDLIFVDLYMPDIGGLEIIETLRAKSNPNQKTPMILITGEALERLPERINQLKIRVLSKPLDIRAFYYLLQSYQPRPSDQIQDC